MERADCWNDFSNTLRERSKILWQYFSAFKALRPTDRERQHAVAALPYDVVNTRRGSSRSENENPDSFLHVDRAEMDLPERRTFMMRRFMRKRKRTLHNMEGDWRSGPGRDSRATTYMNWYARGRLQTGIGRLLLLLMII